MRVAGIDFEEQVVPLDFPRDNSHLLAFSPSKRVPVLIDGDLPVWDSMAILEYLAERFPDAGLWPQDSASRAHARAISMEMHAGFAALRKALPMNMHRNPAPLAYGEETVRDITRITEIWQDCRERFGGAGGFLFGNFTIADAMFAPVVSRFQTYQVPVGEQAGAYMRALRELRAWTEWEEAAMREDWVITDSEL